MTTLNIKNKIMFQVYLVYLLRKLTSPFIAEAVLFLVLAASLLFFVSVPSVFSNMLASGHFYHYMVTAVFQADFLVKTILVLSGATAIFFVRNITVHTLFKERLA